MWHILLTLTVARDHNIIPKDNNGLLTPVYDIFIMFFLFVSAYALLAGPV